MNPEASPPPLLELAGAQVAALRDPARVVLEEVTWSVCRGDFWVVAGAQHSGKSDLLFHAAGLVAPRVGACRVLGCDASEWADKQVAVRQRVGFAFADEKLFHRLTLAENIALPLRYHQTLPEDEAEERVAGLLEAVELTPYAEALPDQVPAVWRRRAGLARALALRPEVLLLDNPDGNLPTRHRDWMLKFLDQLWRGQVSIGGGPLTLVVTTDDLPPWEHSGRRFAGVHGRRFTVLGPWGSALFQGHPAVQEMLTTTPSPSRPGLR